MGHERMPVDYTPQAMPVTSECITTISNVHSLPENLIYSILGVEGGVVGRKTANITIDRCKKKTEDC